MTPPANAADLERLGADPGVCRRCRHRELLSSERSVFLRCERAATDARFARYPRLPVLQCPGFEAEGEPQEGER